MPHYKYKNLLSYNSESSIKNDYEKKLQIISDVIYPEYKKGRTIDELANCYKLESYLIEEYIYKMENKQSDNKLSTSDDKQTDYNNFYKEQITILGNKLLTLEEKLDYIINVISK